MVALSMGGLKLFLARDDVRTLELAEDMQPAAAEDHELGWHEVQGEHVPVYGLGEQLTLLTQKPASSRIAVVLAAGEASIAIVCDEIAFLERDELLFQDIPDCMNRRRSLLSGLAIYDGTVGCVTTSKRLAAYLLESAQSSNTELTP
jgi:chemotaxis signal transduction protein